MLDYINYFKQFAKQQIQSEPKQWQYDLKLKRDHSLRVLDNSIAICNSLKIAEEDCYLTNLAALFHDIGRFAQYKKYHTFDDKKSCNHGVMGAKTLVKDKILEKLPLLHQKRIIGTVALHNRATLPKISNQKLLASTKIVRDADKIDIMGVLIDTMKNGVHENSQVLMNLKDNPNDFSPSIYNSLKTKKQANYSDMNFLNDFWMLQLSWIYDFNTNFSLYEINKREYPEFFFQKIKHINTLNKLIPEIKRDLSSNIIYN